MLMEQPDPNSPKQTPISLELSGPKAAKPLKMHTRKTTSRRLQFYPTEIASIPQALHDQSPRTIPLQELAESLNVDPSRLLPAIKCGYIKVVTSNPPVVYEPPPAAIKWLRSMYEPILMRPFLEINMVAELEDIPVPDVRRLCLSYDIPIHMDECFGELLTIMEFRKLHVCLHHYKEPSRFDRQAMLVNLMRVADPETFNADLKPPPYSVRLEKEIRRISKLPEPRRTEMALMLWEQFSEAKTIADCVAVAKGLKSPTIRGTRRIEKLIEVKETENPAG